jgi:predicted metallo-beta-lactamase superfamily hydrolase
MRWNMLRERKTDFDKLVAYLILDVGVEMVLKTFLWKHHHPVWKKLEGEDHHDIRALSFFKIVGKVEKNTKDRGIEISDANHFHDLRNDLYHKG